MSKETKERLSLRVQPETRRKIDQWYEVDNCRSINEFAEKAITFYCDYLAANDNNALLPTAIMSAIDGRLGTFEDRLSGVIYKQAVELDMLTAILGGAYEFSEETLRRLRSQAAHNVKQTNGCVSFEKRVREAGDE